MGDATLGDVGCTLGDLGCLCGLVARGKGGLGMGGVVGSRVGRFGDGKGCWSGVLVFGGVVVAGMCGSSHRLKRLWRVDIACCWAALVVEGALVMNWR
jgi:hypothetical protein